MKFLARNGSLVFFPCLLLLGSCSILAGPMRTIQAAGRTISDAEDASQAPPIAEQTNPPAIALRIPATN
jgi:hypothetical protein